MDFVINPKTRRKVKVGSKTYKSLLKEGYFGGIRNDVKKEVKGKGNGVKREMKREGEWVKNPRTGRQVKVGSATWKKLVAENVFNPSGSCIHLDVKEKKECLHKEVKEEKKEEKRVCEICYEESNKYVECKCGQVLCNDCKNQLVKPECPFCREDWTRHYNSVIEKKKLEKRNKEFKRELEKEKTINDEEIARQLQEMWNRGMMY